MMSKQADFYLHTRQPTLPEETFQNPGPELRGAPLWSWNCALDRDRLLRQIGQLREMGFGGYHIHCRTGLETPYLGEEFLSMVKDCVDEGQALGMKTWLYDEDRWPSGFGGGLVTADPAHRMKYLIFTPTPYGARPASAPVTRAGFSYRCEDGVLLARYAVSLRDGRLVKAMRLGEDELAAAGTVEWFCYLEAGRPLAWFNWQTYADLLSEASTRKFIEVTHEAYRKAVGTSFGSGIPAIFTDEPQHAWAGRLKRAASEEDVILPFTADLCETYRTQFGEDLLEVLPEVLWERADGVPCRARYRFHRHVTERFAGGFARVLGDWCEANGLRLTGHLMNEPELKSQTISVGDVMQSLAHFHLPGIDILCDAEEWTTAKQAQSIARQYGRPGVMSELYGVTGWGFDFVGHKAQGDWQAALGVTIRVPHLSWVSMAGEAKRDYPASIHYQSPWWQEYHLIEDHFARVAAVMTRGRPAVRVAVVHPIESFWLNYGPEDQTQEAGSVLESRFGEITRWFLDEQIDFDFLSEGLLPTQDVKAGGGGLAVGEMRYDAVLVPALHTLRSSTLNYLTAFVEAGGQLIFVGEIPGLVDASPSGDVCALADRAVWIDWNRAALMAALESWRDLEVRHSEGPRADQFLFQLRHDGDEQHVFLCHRNRTEPSGPVTVRLRGNWRPFLRNTFSGGITEIAARQIRGWTEIPMRFEAHDHALLTFRPGDALAISPEIPIAGERIALPVERVRIELSEPNVLLLDRPEWRWNDGAWQPPLEMLRLHNRVRAECGLPGRQAYIPQPWTDNSPAKVLGVVTLRFEVESRMAVPAPRLVLEEPEAWTICFDGEHVPVQVDGWWTDEDMKCVGLPDITPGKHRIELSRPLDRKMSLEWIYLLGDFGVDLEPGKQGRLIEPVRELAFGDWTGQGMPFYAGNVTYLCPVHLGRDAETAFEFGNFRAALLRVGIAGHFSEPVAFAPFRTAFHRIPAGDHVLEVTAFGNRHNALGPLHNCNPDLVMIDPYAHRAKATVTTYGVEASALIDPNAWRSEGDQWTDNYEIKPMGLMVPPAIRLKSSPNII